MRLVAVYILKHEFLFKDSQIINLGGKYIYHFEETSKGIEISRIINKDFIKDFFGKNVSLVTAIVGANGAGKTSLLKILNGGYKEDTKSIFIYESTKTNKAYFINKIGDFDENESFVKDSSISIYTNNFEINEIDSSSCFPLYYSPIFDEKVFDLYSPLDLNSKNLEDSLTSIFQRNLIYENIFLNSKISKTIKKIYSDFPTYSENVIYANKLYKSDLKKVYIDSNIGYTNVLQEFRKNLKWDIETLINRITGIDNGIPLEQLERKIQFFTFLLDITDKDNLLEMFSSIIANILERNDKQIELEDFFLKLDIKNKKTTRKIKSDKIEIDEGRFIDRIDYLNLSKEEKEEIINRINYLKNLSIIDMLDLIWEDYPVMGFSNSHLIHSNDNFIKNLEANILSFVVLNDIFTLNGFQGSFDSSKIIEEKNFSIRMNIFLRKYLIQKHELIYKNIIKNLTEDFDIIKDKDKIIKIIESDKFSRENGSDTFSIKKRMIDEVQGFYDIMDFYYFIKTISPDSSKSEIKLNVNDKKTKDLLVILFEKYEKVKKYFGNVYLKDRELIAIKPDKNLSFGEKSLLNIYSIFYEFSLHKKNIPKDDNFLLLIDEGDLGYHALWKKKYINAIVKTLPVLLIGNNKKKSIQLVFTTHDPLTLSDVPNENIIYLNKEASFNFVVERDNKPKKSFGANITDLLADSFFINNGLIGEFAKERIDETIEWINVQKKSKENLKNDYVVNEKKYRYYQKIISIIDEHVIRLKLAEMLEELKGEKKLQKELIDREIKFLQDKMGKL